MNQFFLKECQYRGQVFKGRNFRAFAVFSQNHERKLREKVSYRKYIPAKYLKIFESIIIFANFFLSQNHDFFIVAILFLFFKTNN